MLKSLFLFCILALVLNAGDKVEIYASSMTSKDNIVTINDGVNVIYQEYFLTADRAVYNRNSGELELFENVRLNNGVEYKVLGNYAKLNISKKERLFQPFYFSDKETQLWISAEAAQTVDKDIDITSGMLSGCDPLDPIWKMEFTSSDYNSDSQWMNVYNARLYIGDIPILYTPYFGYSLDNTRRTGLLMPSLGYSKREGVYYEQPIYIAEQNWWDLEITPQVRTSRGAGVYQTFRFVDSPTSRGRITAGYFKEKTKYFEEHDLENNAHYGFNVNYDNNDFINQWFGTSMSGQSGLYVDVSSMNDVDYINLSSNNTQDNVTSTQVLSRINLFYNTDDHYSGAYFKYYQNLTLPNDDATLQQLPTLQYHYYLDTFFEDHLSYNTDIKVNNITRKEGVTILQTDVSIPVTLQTSLFDEYLNLSYEAKLYMQYSAFGSESDSPALEYNDGYVARNTNRFAASSQLTKAFEKNIHVVSFGISHNMSGATSQNGYYEDCDNNPNVVECEFYKVSALTDDTQIEFIQYLYDENAKEIFYHRLTQGITYGDEGTTLGKLENELDYKITSYLSLYDNTFFDYDENHISKTLNKITLSNYGVVLNLSHLYKAPTLVAPLKTSYLTSTLSYTYDSHYTFNGLYNYDLEATETQEKVKSMQVGFMYKTRCWDFGLSYSENNRPILTSGGKDSSTYDKYVYLTVALKPIMQNDGKPVLTYQLPDED